MASRDTGSPLADISVDFRVPEDAAVAEAERRGLAPLDSCADSPAVQAIEAMLDRLLAEQQATALVGSG